MVRPTPTNRPRVAGEREDEILDATLALLLDLGYDRLTMDAVAKRARASKATLYRRWETKATLVIDALVRAKGAPHVDDHDTGSLRGDLLSVFCGPDGPMAGAATGVLGAVITALSTDPEFAEKFRDRFIRPKIEINIRIYQRAQARGEIAQDLDLEVIAPALAGIVLHRRFILGLAPDDDAIQRVVDHVILPAVHHDCRDAPGPDQGRSTAVKAAAQEARNA